MTAGPASGTASPSTTKMPVPSVAPMLIMVSCHRPRERRRLPPSPWPPSATSAPPVCGAAAARRLPGVRGSSAGGRLNSLVRHGSVSSRSVVRGAPTLRVAVRGGAAGLRRAGAASPQVPPPAGTAGAGRAAVRSSRRPVGAGRAGDRRVPAAAVRSSLGTGHLDVTPATSRRLGHPGCVTVAAGAGRFLPASSPAWPRTTASRTSRAPPPAGRCSAACRPAR